MNTNIITEDGTTLIPLTLASFPLPRKLLQGGHEKGAIITGDQVAPWSWHGFRELDGVRYVRCDEIGLEPLETIFSMPEKKGLERISDLAHALGKLSGDAALTGYFMFGEIFLTDTGGFLILPSTLREIMGASRSEEELFEERGQWSNPKYYGEQALAFELTAMAYALLNGGKSPAAPSQMRQDSYQALPIELLRQGIDGKLASFFSTRLSRRQEIDATLTEWETAFDAIRDLPSGSWKGDSEAAAEYIGRQEKRAKRKESLRIHRVRNMVLATLTVVCIGIAYSVISAMLEPPLTAGMDAREVVNFYYDAHNNLDALAAEDTLAKGVDNPAEQTLTYLHVTTSVRQAYEFDSGFVPADEWVAAGKPDLDAGKVVYGITDLELEWLDSVTVRAEYLLWSPVFPDEDTMERASPAEAARIVEELDLALNGKYWEITAIRRISAEAVQ